MQAYNFGSRDAKDSFLELAERIILSSTALTTVEMGYLYLSAAQTEKIFAALNASPSLSILEKVTLLEFVDLTSEDTCISMVEFIAEATNLTEFNIEHNIGRKIDLEVTCTS